jgi:hypothetical protein
LWRVQWSAPEPPAYSAVAAAATAPTQRKEGERTSVRCPEEIPTPPPPRSWQPWQEKSQHVKHTGTPTLTHMKMHHTAVTMEGLRYKSVSRRGILRSVNGSRHRPCPRPQVCGAVERCQFVHQAGAVQQGSEDPGKECVHTCRPASACDGACGDPRPPPK